MEHIKMMEDLMRKSIEVRNSYTEKTKVSKDEMLAKAKEKIENYFDEVLKNCPLKDVSVELKDKDIRISISKNSDAIITKDKYSSEVLSKKFVLIKISDNHYSLKEDFNGCMMNKYFYLYTLGEKQILKIIENFDLIKEETEKTIVNRMNKILEKNAESIKTEENNLKTLENFLS